MNDDQFMQIAVQKRYVTPGQMCQSLDRQRQLAEAGERKPLFLIAQDLGFIDKHRAGEILQYLSSTEVRALEIDGYRIAKKLGRGGMGVVYEGINAAGTSVAIKLLPSSFSDDPECVARFTVESRITQRLRHRHIVRTIGTGSVDGQRYLVMEIVRGPSLGDLLRRGNTLTEKEALVLLAQMASALAYAWNHGVLHRDIKPSNILLAPPRRHDEPICAQLCDFGVAKIWSMTEQGMAYWQGKITGPGVSMGTPEYMSPEQATGRDLDLRSDMYNLGATVYHTLVGREMFSGKAAEVLRNHRDTAPDMGAALHKGISAQTIAILATMLAKQPAARFQDWETLLEHLRPLAPDAVATAQVDAGSRLVW
ncbi:MAG: protein kinase [Planctomycetes bacterium]|nr:protein kinase [Planctomycetota bacterium]